MKLLFKLLGIKRDCRACGNTGWRTVIRGGFSGAERCSCGAVPSPSGPLEFNPITAADVERAERDRKGGAA